MKVLTTGKVAKLLHVAPRTVSKWFDSGKLKGYRIPGSLDRRVPQSSLVEFCRAHGMPLDGVQTNVLIVTQDAMLIEAVQALVGQSYRIIGVGNAFEAGRHADSAELVMVDLALGEDVARSLIKSVGGPFVVAAIVPEGMPIPAGFGQALLKSPESVASSISMLLGG